MTCQQLGLSTITGRLGLASRWTKALRPLLRGSSCSRQQQNQQCQQCQQGRQPSHQCRHKGLCQGRGWPQQCLQGLQS